MSSRIRKSSKETVPAPVSAQARAIGSAKEATSGLRTLRDLLRWSVSRMAQASVQTGHGTASLRDEAAAMLLWALHLPADELDLWLDASVLPEERRAIVDLIERRCSSRLPAPYLTGESWLRGICFRSDARALVPRSLIAEALDSSLSDYLQHFPRPDAWPRSILDLCTGGGSLAVLAALRYPQSQVSASDLSREALDLARENVSLHGLEGRISLHQGDLFQALAGQRFDLVLCNPPYVCEASMQRLPAEYLAEPRMALAGGEDGMDIVRRILDGAASFLSDEGLLLIEIGHEAEHFERAFPKLEFMYLPVEAGEQMLVLVEARALQTTHRKPGRRRAQ